MLISIFRFPAFCEILFPQSLFMGKCHFYVKYSHLLSRLYHWIYSISFIVVEGILFPLLIRFYIFLAIIDIFLISLLLGHTITYGIVIMNSKAHCKNRIFMKTRLAINSVIINTLANIIIDYPGYFLSCKDYIFHG